VEIIAHYAMVHGPTELLLVYMSELVSGHCCVGHCDVFMCKNWGSCQWQPQTPVNFSERPDDYDEKATVRPAVRECPLGSQNRAGLLLLTEARSKLSAQSQLETYTRWHLFRPGVASDT
jgi:hypothetical protein